MQMTDAVQQSELQAEQLQPADQQVAAHVVTMKDLPGQGAMTTDQVAQVQAGHVVTMTVQSVTTMTDQHAHAGMTTDQVAQVQVVRAEMTKDLQDHGGMMTVQCATAKIDQHVRAGMMIAPSVLVMKNQSVVNGQVNVLKPAMIANVQVDQVLIDQIARVVVNVVTIVVVMIVRAEADQIAQAAGLVIEMNVQLVMFQKNE